MWARIVTLISGIWLMIVPDLLDFNKVTSDNDHITGPLIVTFTIIALSECTRNIRFLNLAIGAWLLFAPWILGYDNNIAFASDYTVGIVIVLLTLVPQKRKNHFGGGWATLWKA